MFKAFNMGKEETLLKTLVILSKVLSSLHIFHFSFYTYLIVIVRAFINVFLNVPLKGGLEENELKGMTL